MSVAEILGKVATGQLSAEEATKLIGSAQKSAGGLVCKLNSSGGVYVRHPKFLAHSKAKDKDYVAGINLDAAVARALFCDEAVLAEVRAAVVELLK